VEENLIRLLSYKKKSPGDSPFDLLLATGEVAGQKISFEDVVANAFLIIGAGLETTSNAMSTAFFWMSHHKEERQKLIDRPDMMRHAVEEFLRYQGIRAWLASNCHRGCRVKWVPSEAWRHHHGELRCCEPRRGLA
jgi:cytochrome P450